MDSRVQEPERMFGDDTGAGELAYRDHIRDLAAGLVRRSNSLGSSDDTSSRNTSTERRPGLTFGRSLSHMRTSRHMSQAKLAREANLDPGFISRLEADKRNPQVRTVKRIAARLNCTEAETFELMVAAGYVTRGSENRMYRLAREPEMNQLLDFLDPSNDNDEMKDLIRRTVRELIKIVEDY